MKTAFISRKDNSLVGRWWWTVDKWSLVSLFILIGIGLSFFMAALTQTLLTYGATENAISALSWLAGSVNQATWLDSKILGFVLFFILTIQLAQARLFKPTALGYETSIGLGVSMPLFGASQMSIAVIAASIATAVVGPMGFVGLLAPHIARRLVASSAFVFILLTATIGATLVLLADLIGRTWFGSTAIAAGLITSLVGAPTFIFLVLKQKQN